MTNLPAKPRRDSWRGPSAHAGMTLIELMVSLLIGLFLSWGAIQVYVQSKSNYRAAEVATRLQENARFALETLEPDVRLAGFWGRHADPARVGGPGPGTTIRCSGSGIDVTDWALDLTTPIAAVDDIYDLDCDPFATARGESDVLIVRRAGDLRVVPQANQLQMHGDLSRAQLFDDGIVPAGFDAAAETRDVVVHAYYVDEESSFSADVPSLRRKTLVRGNVVEDQEMISGIENLQVQLGVDTNGDGSVDRYADADEPVVAGTRVAAVRLWLLLRSEESPGPGFRDAREYVPADADIGPITPGDDAAYPAGFQRLSVTKTIYLRNQGGS